MQKFKVGGLLENETKQHEIGDEQGMIDFGRNLWKPLFIPHKQHQHEKRQLVKHVKYEHVSNYTRGAIQ